MHSLQDRVAIVTGATSGIGRSSALPFVRQGALIAQSLNQMSAFAILNDRYLDVRMAAMGTKRKLGWPTLIQKPW